MRQIDADMAENFYAAVLLPLRHANARRNVHYFATDFDPHKTSYWEPVTSRTGGSESILLGEQNEPMERLARYWRSHSEETLTRMLPALAQLRAALAAEPATNASADARVPDFVYPLF